MYKFWIVLLITTNVFGMEKLEEKDKVTILCGTKQIVLPGEDYQVEWPSRSAPTLFMGAAQLINICREFGIFYSSKECPFGCGRKFRSRDEVRPHLFSGEHLGLLVVCPCSNKEKRLGGFVKHRAKCPHCKPKTTDPISFSFKPNKKLIKRKPIWLRFKNPNKKNKIN